MYLSVALGLAGAWTRALGSSSRDGAMAVTSLLRNIRPPSHRRPPPQVTPSCSPGVSLQSGSVLVLCWLNVLGAHKLLLMFGFHICLCCQTFVRNQALLHEVGLFFFCLFFLLPPPTHYSVVLMNDLCAYRKLLWPAWPWGRKRKPTPAATLLQKFRLLEVICNK